MPDKKFNPGYSWRFNAPSNREKSSFRNVEGDGHSYVDELVIDDWFHLEMMDHGSWWLRIGNNLNINISIDIDGNSSISIDDYNKRGEVAKMLSKELIDHILNNKKI